MKKIPLKLRKQMENDPYYQVCARKCSECDGRITWEHAIIYAGGQLNEKWAIIPLCEYHHAVGKHQDGGDLNKEINRLIALNRATDKQLESISKAINYKRERERLRVKYAIS
jgi:hypothetical protein